MAKHSVPFFVAKYSELKPRADFIFLSWASQFPWKHETSVHGIEELNNEFGRQFENEIKTLQQHAAMKKRALDSLKHRIQQEKGFAGGDEGRFVEHALEYFLRVKFPIPDHLAEYSNHYKLKWVINAYAYEFFGQDLNEEEKLKVGRPKLEDNIDFRRHLFASSCINEFLSWAYELYRAYNSLHTFPVTVKLRGEKNDFRPIYIIFKNQEEMNSLFKFLKKIKRIHLFRHLQDALWNEEMHPQNTEILKYIDDEIGLTYEGKLIDEQTIAKSLSAGKSACKVGRTQKKKGSPIDIRQIYQTNKQFLRAKYLFK